MPFRQVALGLLIAALAVRVDGVDVIVDPLGWLLVIGGSQRLGGDPRTRSRVTTAAVVAFAVSVPLAFPAVLDTLADADPSLAWAVSLPQIVVLLLLALHLIATAQEAGDVDAAAWWRWVRTGTIVIALAPAVLFPARSPELIGLGVFLALVTFVLAVVLLWIQAPRSWAIVSGPVISAPEPPSPS